MKLNPHYQFIANKLGILMKLQNGWWKKMADAIF